MWKRGQREYRAINLLMGLMFIAIAIQVVLTGIRIAFPPLAGGYHAGLGSRIVHTDADREQDTSFWHTHWCHDH